MKLRTILSYHYKKYLKYRHRWHDLLPIASICLVAMTITSCEEVFTPDIDTTPVLCINSIVTAGEPIDVRVSKSRLYTDAANQSSVTDAMVEVYANGVLQIHDYVPGEGDKVEIRATSPGFGQAKGEVIIPKATPITGIKWEPFDMVCLEYSGRINITFKLNVRLTISDPIGDNYYMFYYNNLEPIDWDWENPSFDASHEPFYLSIGSLQYQLEPLFSEHIGVFESVMGGDADGFNFFTDRQFPGQSYTLNLQFDSCRFHGTLEEMPDCRYAFVLNTISKSFYNWACYIWQKDNGTLTELGDVGLGDPVWGYSNVDTGAGIIAAQSPFVYVVDFTDFIFQVIKGEY